MKNRLRKSIKKKFSENINSSELLEEYRSPYLNRVIMYFIQISKSRIKNVIGLFGYALFKIREKHIIDSITNTTGKF